MDEFWTKFIVLKDHQAIINAGKTFTAEPQLAETTQVIIINEEEEDGEDGEIDDTKRENKFRAITTILTECSKHRVLEAFKWYTGSSTPVKWDKDDNSTRPAEFWEALTQVAPQLQHLSLEFYAHELQRMKETGISVRRRIFWIAML